MPPHDDCKHSGGLLIIELPPKVPGVRAADRLYVEIHIIGQSRLSCVSIGGMVVHVPYTELLNADSTPQAEKVIWKILVKAGVLKYAEIVCFSDDPGEVAVKKFVLKLMGCPM